MDITNTLDINDVLIHMQHFYEVIIPKATNKSDWDKQEIIIAFKWAKFFEEVYLKCKGTSNAGKVDDYLHSIGKGFTEIYKIPLCFDDLRRASLLLSQAFFDNAHVKDFDIQAALQNEESIENYFTKNMTDTIVLGTLSYDLIESLKPIKMETSSLSLYYKTKSELFLDFLKNFIEHHSTASLEHQLYSTFASLCEVKKNMPVFIYLLLYNVDEDVVAEQIQHLAVKWMLLQLYSDNSCSLAKFIWRLSPMKMRDLAAKHETFSCYYLYMITKCVNSLEEIEERDKDTWNFRIFTTNDKILSFDQIVNHFQILLNAEGDLGERVRQHIKHILKTTPDHIVWKEIILKLKNL